MHRDRHRRPGGIIPAVESSPPAAPDLSGMTKAQLLSHAAEAGVEGVNSRMSKAEIINAIKG